MLRSLVGSEMCIRDSKRPFLAALCYRYLPPCSTAGRPFTGRAPVLLWSATPCWLWPACCGLQRMSSCCKNEYHCVRARHAYSHISVCFCLRCFSSFRSTAAPRTRSPCLPDWKPCQSNELCVHHFGGGSRNTRMHSTHDWSLRSRLPAQLSMHTIRTPMFVLSRDLHAQTPAGRTQDTLTLCSSSCTD